MERVMLTLPPELLLAVDAAARQLGEKRSHVVRQALEQWLELRRREQFEALLAEGYQAMAQAASARAAESLFLQAAAAEGVWHWDE